MEKRVLGNGLEVSAVGLGCMGFTHAYGPPCDLKEAKCALEESIEMGYTFFDTAERYFGFAADGTQLWNEELVGEALAGCRSQVKIATKFGIGVTQNGEMLLDSRPQTIRSSVEGSLKRLGTDYIDLYYQHRTDPGITPEEVAGVMADLIKEGKILHWGISETDEEYLRRAHAVCPVTAIQNRYSMMARWHETLFAALEELHVGYVAFSPLANGFLTAAYQNEVFTDKDDYRSNMPQYTKEGYAENAPVIELVRRYAEEKNATPAQISLAWMLCKKPYIVPIPGSRKTERLRENAKAAEIRLSPEEVAEIDSALDRMELSVYGGASYKVQEGEES
ncbi:MAG: aldo/keto reductase [Lachnospiraceae bacterium]|nr:aldo/keto reductase [Acetatifactor muris]MCM1224116.1 aldo/keto reductase [Lachnospiraceae bacterium]